MFIVEIIGGLGNQMFCYAFAKAIEHHYGKGSVALYTGRFQHTKDNMGFELDSVFGIDDPVISDENEVRSLIDDSWSLPARLRRKLFGQKKTYYKEQIYTYDSRVFNLDIDVKRIYLQGLWQDENYFKDIRSEIIKKITFTRELSEENASLMSEIKQSISVSLHVRRGDYISNEFYRNILGNVCTYQYYLDSLKYLEKRLGSDLSYYIFSDDIAWVKANFDFLENRKTVFVKNNKGINSYIDMQLMSYCNHNIIANSTFSWWGAWLNQNPTKIVIAPNRWFRDSPGYENNHIVPDDWIKINVE